MKTKKISIILFASLVLIFFGFSTAIAGWVDGTIIGVNIFPSGTIQLKVKKADGSTFASDIEPTLSATLKNQILASALTAETVPIPVSVNLSSGKINALKLVSE